MWMALLFLGGFEKKWAWPGREGEPDNRIGVGPSAEQGGEAFEINLIDNPEAGPSGTSFVYFQMTGVEEIYARCQRHKANIYLELGDRDWGMKDFRVTDPFGNKLGFGEVL